jgi:hypothetical protein
VKFNRIADKAKQAIDKRGGMDALKGDLQEVQEIAKRRGSLKDKAKAAADAVKEPGKAGAPGDRPRPDGPTGTRDDDPPPRAA